MTSSTQNPPVVLTMAGTDSGGAAGVAADLATFAALGAHGACVITAVTAQDTTGVHDVHAIPLDTVAAQLDAVFDDLPVAAAKTGMLGTPQAVELAAERVAPRVPLVVDPVLVATSGAVLGDEQVAKAYLAHLLPVAAVVTPNLDEARALTGSDGPADELAARLADAGCAVVVTGGLDTPLAGARGYSNDPGSCTDWVAMPGETAVPITHAFVSTENDHGTGCTYSAALAVHLARVSTRSTTGWLAAAASAAAGFTSGQLQISKTWTLGRGRGPIAHVSTSSTTGAIAQQRSDRGEPK